MTEKNKSSNSVTADRDTNRLDLFKKKGIAFIHIPKAGGSSFERMIYGKVPSNHQRAVKFFHMDPECFEQLIKLVMVRNPYNRVYSAFKYLAKGGNGSKKDIEKSKVVLNGGANFKEFVKNSLEKHMLSSKKVIFFKSQLWYIQNDERTDLLVDHIIKLEEADAAIDALSDLYPNFSSMKLPWERRGDVGANFQEYYDQETADIVYKLYKPEFELFNYGKDSWLNWFESNFMSTEFSITKKQYAQYGSLHADGSRKVLKYRDGIASSIPSYDQLVRHVANQKKLSFRSSRSLIGETTITKICDSTNEEFSVNKSKNMLQKARVAKESESIFVTPEANLQEAIDKVFSKGGGVVRLSEGIFVVEEPIRLRSGVNIIGAGAGCHFSSVVTSQKFDIGQVSLPDSTTQEGETLLVYGKDAHWPMFSNLTELEIKKIKEGLLEHGSCLGRDIKNVTLADFRIHGGLSEAEMLYPVYFHEDDHPLHCKSKKKLYQSPRGNDLLGVFITAAKGAVCREIHFKRLIISNTGMGIQVRGCTGSSVADCVFFKNGSIAEHWHNLYYRRSSKLKIVRNLSAFCLSGNGLNANEIHDIEISGNLVIENYFRGLRVNICSGDFELSSNLIYGNGETGLRLTGCGNVDVSSNFSRENGKNFDPCAFVIGKTCRTQYISANCVIR
jgi:hypothetical protein